MEKYIYNIYHVENINTQHYFKTKFERLYRNWAHNKSIEWLNDWMIWHYQNSGIRIQTIMLLLLLNIERLNKRVGLTKQLTTKIQCTNDQS